MATPTFITRTEIVDTTDYISQANAEITQNGTIDINSPTYQNALEQYNTGLSKGSIIRLDVPTGFCGYIDPNTGKYRVEPEPLVLPTNIGLPISNITGDESEDDNISSQYPNDRCLWWGLPGSYLYSTGNCGDEDGDSICTYINWFATSRKGRGSKFLGICGDGPGINSNTGLAKSNTIFRAPSILDDTPPLKVWNEAQRKGQEEYPISLGFEKGMYSIVDIVGIEEQTLITYNVFFNVNDPDGSEGVEHFHPSGLKIIIEYNPFTDMLVPDESGVVSEAIKMWPENWFTSGDDIGPIEDYIKLML